MKTEPIGTVWASRARIQIIDESRGSPRWMTVESCIDTPVAIGNALAKARGNHPDSRLWVKSGTNGRIMA